MPDFTCPDCGFTSTGWPTKKAADARGKQHANEHETGELMDDLHTFREDQGLIVNVDGSVTAKGN